MFENSLSFFLHSKRGVVSIVINNALYFESLKQIRALHNINQLLFFLPQMELLLLSSITENLEG